MLMMLARPAPSVALFPKQYLHDEYFSTGNLRFRAWGLVQGLGLRVYRQSSTNFTHSRTHTPQPEKSQDVSRRVAVDKMH